MTDKAQEIKEMNEKNFWKRVDEERKGITASKIESRKVAAANRATSDIEATKFANAKWEEVRHEAKNLRARGFDTYMAAMCELMQSLIVFAEAINASNPIGSVLSLAYEKFLRNKMEEIEDTMEAVYKVSTRSKTAEAKENLNQMKSEEKKEEVEEQTASVGFRP